MLDQLDHMFFFVKNQGLFTLNKNYDPTNLKGTHITSHLKMDQMMGSSKFRKSPNNFQVAPIFRDKERWFQGKGTSNEKDTHVLRQPMIHLFVHSDKT